MSPEIRLTGKLTAIIGLITVIFSVAASWTTGRLQTSELEHRTEDHEERLRTLEACISSDISSIKADIRWIVYTLEDLQLP
jgi:hypothetical protein